MNKAKQAFTKLSILYGMLRHKRFYLTAVIHFAIRAVSQEQALLSLEILRHMSHLGSSGWTAIPVSPIIVSGLVVATMISSNSCPEGFL